MRTPAQRSATLLALLLLLTTPLLKASELYVTLKSPSPGQPVFGEVMVEVEVEPLGQVTEVDLFVDNHFVARLNTPPFRLPVNLGQGNAEHRFEAVARGSDIKSGRALLVTPALRVDVEVELRLQQLYVTVQRGHEPVLDLTESDFRIFDQGKAQRIVTFERGAVPLTAVLLIDASSSMRGRPLAAARRGARAFFTHLRTLDLAKLLLFSDRVIHTTPFTGFGSVLATGLGGIRADGGTALNDHLYLALHRLEERQGRRVVVLLSDGVEVASTLDVDDVIWLARRSQAQIYWLRLGRQIPTFRTAWRDQEANRRQSVGLITIVQESGGRIIQLGHINEIEGAFAAVLQELRDQYVLGYYPSQSLGNGSWHEVQVRTRQPRLAVRTRVGYIDR